MGFAGRDPMGRGLDSITWEHQMFQSNALRLVIFAALSCFFAAGTLFGETFYVATTGNDTTGTGSTTAPWAPSPTLCRVSP